MDMLPSEADVRISAPVLLFTMAATTLAGLLFGSAPAWQASRLDLNEVLKQGGRSASGGMRRNLRRILVVVEFALALTLLAGGGLALRSFWKLTRMDLGVRSDHLLTFLLATPQGRFSDAEHIIQYYRQILEKIESVPGVEKATVTTGMPTQGTNFGMAFSVAGAPPVDRAARPRSRFEMVTPGYFETFGIRVVKGRSFNEQDTAQNTRVVIINESFADRYFPGVDPLTQRLVISELSPGKPFVEKPVEWQIVGVVNNVRTGRGLRSDIRQIYAPFWQSPWHTTLIAARTSGDPTGITASVAAAVNSVDPDLPLADVRTLDQRIGELLAFDRFGMVLYGSFAALALLLAAVGIYGVMNFAIAQRTNEFGLRMALGARSSNIMKMVLREGGTLAFIGMAFGLGGAYMVGRAMYSTLYGVSAMDVGSFGVAAITLLAAALLACYIPARRASKVDPMVALRCE
jgi:putative ABC transport system permease protein